MTLVAQVLKLSAPLVVIFGLAIPRVSAAQENLLDVLKRAIQPQAENVPARRPVARKVDVPGQVPDLNDQSCASNSMLRTATITFSEERRKTAGSHTFLDSEPIEKMAGITGAEVQGARLMVHFFTQGLFEEFRGPVVQVVEKKRYEARPGSALIGHTLTLGIGLLLSPGKSAQHAFGCTDTRVMRQEVLVESVPTGQSRWLPMDNTHVLRLEGFGVSREFNFTSDRPNGRGSFELDLMQAVMQASPDQVQELRVTCVSCNAREGAIPGQSLALQNQVVLRPDFAQARASELARLERIAQEERSAAQKKLEQEQALMRFKKALVGRWAPQEVCLSGKSQAAGQIYELDGAQRLALRLNFLEGPDRVIERYAARDIAVNPANRGENSWELRLNLQSSIAGVRPVTRLMVVKLQEEVMQVLDLLDGTTVVTRSGVNLTNGREQAPLFNCLHPKLVAQRTQIEREERERVRRAQAEAEEQRQRVEREEAQRVRRQQERERLYKL